MTDEDDYYGDGDGDDNDVDVDGDGVDGCWNLAMIG